MRIVLFLVAVSGLVGFVVSQHQGHNGTSVASQIQPSQTVQNSRTMNTETAQLVTSVDKNPALSDRHIPLNSKMTQESQMSKAQIGDSAKIQMTGSQTPTPGTGLQSPDPVISRTRHERPGILLSRTQNINQPSLLKLGPSTVQTSGTTVAGPAEMNSGSNPQSNANTVIGNQGSGIQHIPEIDTQNMVLSHPVPDAPSSGPVNSNPNRFNDTLDAPMTAGCPGQKECETLTGHYYHAAKGDFAKRCQALYFGLNCLDRVRVNCFSALTVGLTEAIRFAIDQLDQLNCTAGLNVITKRPPVATKPTTVPVTTRSTVSPIKSGSGAVSGSQAGSGTGNVGQVGGNFGSNTQGGSGTGSLEQGNSGTQSGTGMFEQVGASLGTGNQRKPGQGDVGQVEGQVGLGTGDLRQAGGNIGTGTQVHSGPEDLGQVVVSTATADQGGLGTVNLGQAGENLGTGAQDGLGQGGLVQVGGNLGTVAPGGTAQVGSGQVGGSPGTETQAGIAPVDSGKVGGNQDTEAQAGIAPVDSGNVGGGLGTGAAAGTAPVDSGQVGGNPGTEAQAGIDPVDTGEVGGNLGTGAQAGTAPVDAGQVEGVIGATDQGGFGTVDTGQVGGNLGTGAKAGMEPSVLGQSGGNFGTGAQAGIVPVDAGKGEGSIDTADQRGLGTVDSGHLGGNVGTEAQIGSGPSDFGQVNGNLGNAAQTGFGTDNLGHVAGNLGTADQIGPGLDLGQGGSLEPGGQGGFGTGNVGQVAGEFETHVGPTGHEHVDQAHSGVDIEQNLLGKDGFKLAHPVHTAPGSVNLKAGLLQSIRAESGNTPTNLNLGQNMGLTGGLANFANLAGGMGNTGTGSENHFGNVGLGNAFANAGNMESTGGGTEPREPGEGPAEGSQGQLGNFGSAGMGNLDPSILAALGNQQGILGGNLGTLGTGNLGNLGNQQGIMGGDLGTMGIGNLGNLANLGNQQGMMGGNLGTMGIGNLGSRPSENSLSAKLKDFMAGMSGNAWRAPGDGSGVIIPNSGLMGAVPGSNDFNLGETNNFGNNFGPAVADTPGFPASINSIGAVGAGEQTVDSGGSRKTGLTSCWIASLVVIKLIRLAL